MLIMDKNRSVAFSRLNDAKIIRKKLYEFVAAFSTTNHTNFTNKLLKSECDFIQ